MRRSVTLCMAYYMNAGMLSMQFDRLRSLPKHLLSHVKVIVVDDGSPDGQAKGEPIGCPLMILRIQIDVRWNQDAARNIAALHADDGWLLLTDMDHMVPQATWARIIEGKLDSRIVYRFARRTLERRGRALIETPYKPHPNSWLMTRELYEQIGGYDERFAGHYGTDAEFRDRIAAVTTTQMLVEHLIRVPRETVPDASTRNYGRKGDPLDAGAIPRIKAERAKMPDWRPLRFRFPYECIYRCNT